MNNIVNKNESWKNYEYTRKELWDFIPLEKSFELTIWLLSSLEKIEINLPLPLPGVLNVAQCWFASTQVFLSLNSRRQPDL